MLKSLLKNVYHGTLAFTGGFCIGTSFILISNDLFYKTITTKSTKEIFEELKPKEIFGKGAKSTFMKHHIEEDPNETTNKYYQYVDKIKNIGREMKKEEDLESMKKDIFDKK